MEGRPRGIVYTEFHLHSLLCPLLCSSVHSKRRGIQAAVQHSNKHRVKWVCTQGQGVKSPELCKLAPLETPRALQDIKTDLVQLFLTNMASDEVKNMVTSPAACPPPPSHPPPPGPRSLLLLHPPFPMP